MKPEKVYYFLLSSISALTVGLLLNGYYQAKTYQSSLSSQFKMAAFLSPNANKDVVREKLRNIDGISSIELIDASKAWEKAVAQEPSLKEILVTGNNPFTPYFLINASSVNPETISAIDDAAANIKDIDEVRFDSKLISVIDTLRRNISLYRVSFIIISAIILLVIILKFIIRIINETTDYLNYLYVSLAGLAAGISGAALYYSVSRHILGSNADLLPANFLPYLIASGIVIVLAWEK